MNSLLIFIYWTCASKQEARDIAAFLLKNHSIIQADFFPVESLFWWEQQIEQEREVKVIFKTYKEKFNEVREWIQSRAQYAVSEILEIPITRDSV